MRYLLISSFLFLLLCSCAPQTWTRADTGDSQRERDLAACELEGRAEFTASLPREEDFEVRVVAYEESPSDLINEMEASAERAAERSYQGYFEKQVRRYIDECMPRKGYRLADQ